MARSRREKDSAYGRILERVFAARHRQGLSEVAFTREDISQAATEIGIPVPRNLGDLVYSFRYRGQLPESIASAAPPGKGWMILPAGPGRYRFALTSLVEITPNPSLAETKVPDATPGIVSKYALSDEQSLLANVRYNRLIDIFTGVACYSLQNHLRTAVPRLGQVETDEVYVGVDQRGVHYVFPVQAKGQSDRLGIVQVLQDFAVCAHKFPGLIARPIAAQSVASDVIVLFAFEKDGNDVAVSIEKHYRLVPPDAISGADLERYGRRLVEPLT